jgi:hypothetical protein
MTTKQPYRVRIVVRPMASPHGAVTHTVTAYVGRKKVGAAQFRDSGWVRSIRVDAAHQRQGIAGRMLIEASKALGGKSIYATDMSPDGRRLFSQQIEGQPRVRDGVEDGGWTGKRVFVPKEA